jgi:hypothetical protein
MWTHVDAWSKAAEALGVSISGPLILELEGGPAITVDMLVTDFGAPRGTAVCRNYESVRPYMGQIREAGYSVSSFGSYPEGFESSPADLIEVLSDWGWCGDGPAPSWIDPAYAGDGS